MNLAEATSLVRSMGSSPGSASGNPLSPLPHSRSAKTSQSEVNNSAAVRDPVTSLSAKAARRQLAVIDSTLKPQDQDLVRSVVTYVETHLSCESTMSSTAPKVAAAGQLLSENNIATKHSDWCDSQKPNPLQATATRAVLRHIDSASAEIGVLIALTRLGPAGPGDEPIVKDPSVDQALVGVPPSETTALVRISVSKEAGQWQVAGFDIEHMGRPAS